MSRSAFIEAEQQEKRRIAAKRPRPGETPDPEDFYALRKCRVCAELWSFRRGSVIAQTCPGCSGGWLYGDPSLEAWAA